MAVSETVAMGLPEADPQQLLAFSGISAEIQGVLGGEEVVLYLEDQAQSIDWLERVSLSPNPFQKDGPNQLDLSYLDYPTSRTIEGGGRKNGNGRTGHPVRIAVRQRNAILDKNRRALDKTAGDAIKAYESVVREAWNDIEAGEAAIDQHLMEHIGSPEVLDLFLVSDYVELLETTARTLPSSATLETVLNIRTLEGAYYADITAMRRTLLSRIGFPVSLRKSMLISIAASERREAQRLNDNAKGIRKLGKDEYDKVRRIAHKEAVLRSLYLMDDLVTVKQRLSELEQEANDEDRPLLWAAESYVVAKARRAEDVLRRNGEALGDTAIVQRLKSVGTASLHLAQQEREAQQKHETAQELMEQVRDAKEVMVGGRRLASKDPLRTQEIADGLHKIQSRGQNDRLFERCESGLIVAILCDKFGSFVELHQRVTSNDDLASAAEFVKPNVIKTLRKLDLKQALLNIHQALKHPIFQNELDVILQPEGFQKVQITVEEFVEEESSLIQVA